MKEFKKGFAEIILKANEDQQALIDYVANKEIVEHLKHLSFKLSENASLPVETIKLLNRQAAEITEHSDEMSFKGKKPTHDGLNVKNKVHVKNYLSLSKELKVPDVMFEITSIYPGGTKTFIDEVNKLNETGSAIETVYSKQGKEGSTQLVVVMPSSSYAVFLNKISVDHEESKYDVIGERRSNFFAPHLNQDITIDKIKESVKKLMENNFYASECLNKQIGMGYIKMSANGKNTEQQISSAVGTYISSVNKIENGARQDSTITSAMFYNKNTKDPEYAGSSLTPLKEAKRVLPDYTPDVKSKRDKKNEKGFSNKI